MPILVVLRIVNHFFLILLHGLWSRQAKGISIGEFIHFYQHVDNMTQG